MRNAKGPPAASAPPASGLRRITFVTGNAGKVRELSAALAGLAEAVQDRRGYPEIQHDELSGVTEAGAGYLMATGLAPPFLLEDSGLFVDALHGFPGVYSRHALDTIGIEGILRLLAHDPGARTAEFRSDLCYVDEDGAPHHFQGAVSGTLAPAPRGAGGFGFDPIFVPQEGDGRTFAEMTADEKNALSHRGRAVAGFRAFLVGAGAAHS